MTKEELERRRREEAERIAQEIYTGRKDEIMTGFLHGEDVVRIHIDRGTGKFNFTVCQELEKLLTGEGYWCEYYNMMYLPDYIIKVYPGKPKRGWWKKIFG